MRCKPPEIYRPCAHHARSESRFAWLARLSLLSMWGIGACNSEAPPEVALGSSRHDVEAVVDAAESLGEQTPSNKRSAPALIVHWDEASADFKASALHVVIENTTEVSISAHLSVLVASPVGEKRERALTTVRVPARSLEAIELPVKELPLQTEGVASSVVVGAEWVTPGPASTDSNDHERQTLRSFTETRLVTWQPGSAVALVRSERAQTRADEAAFRAGRGPSLSALRVADAATGVMNERAPAGLSALPLAGTRFIESAGPDATSIRGTLPPALPSSAVEGE